MYGRVAVRGRRRRARSSTGTSRQPRTRWPSTRTLQLEQLPRASRARAGSSCGRKQTPTPYWPAGGSSKSTTARKNASGIWMRIPAPSPVRGSAPVGAAVLEVLERASGALSTTSCVGSLSRRATKRDAAGVVLVPRVVEAVGLVWRLVERRHSSAGHLRRTAESTWRRSRKRRHYPHRATPTRIATEHPGVRRTTGRRPHPESVPRTAGRDGCARSRPHPARPRRERRGGPARLRRSRRGARRSTDQMLSDVKLAVTEACTNVVDPRLPGRRRARWRSRAAIGDGQPERRRARRGPRHRAARRHPRPRARPAAHRHARRVAGARDAATDDATEVRMTFRLEPSDEPRVTIARNEATVVVGATAAASGPVLSARRSGCSRRARSARSTASTTRCSSPTRSPPTRPTTPRNGTRPRRPRAPSEGAARAARRAARAGGRRARCSRTRSCPGVGNVARAGRRRGRGREPAPTGERALVDPGSVPDCTPSGRKPALTRRMPAEFALYRGGVSTPGATSSPFAARSTCSPPRSSRRTLTDAIEKAASRDRRRPVRDDLPRLDGARRADRRGQAAALRDGAARRSSTPTRTSPRRSRSPAWTRSSRSSARATTRSRRSTTPSRATRPSRGGPGRGTARGARPAGSRTGRRRCAGCTR